MKNWQGGSANTHPTAEIAMDIAGFIGCHPSLADRISIAVCASQSG
jgi:hypothetical protein